MENNNTIHSDVPQTDSNQDLSVLWNTPQKSSIPNEPPVPSGGANQKTNRRISLRTLVYLLIIVGGIGITVVASGLPQEIRKRAAETGASMTLNPSTISVKKDDTFTLQVLLNTNSLTVSAVKFILKFDQSMLQMVDVQKGDALPTILQKKISDGRILLTLGSTLGAPYIGVGGVFATVTFRAKINGTSVLSIAEGSQVAAIGKTGNMLSTLGQCTVTVSKSGGPTGTVTPTGFLPSPSPTPGGSCGDSCSYTESSQTRLKEYCTWAGFTCTNPKVWKATTCHGAKNQSGSCTFGAFGSSCTPAYCESESGHNAPYCECVCGDSCTYTESNQTALNQYCTWAGFTCVSPKAWKAVTCHGAKNQSGSCIFAAYGSACTPAYCESSPGHSKPFCECID